MLDKAAIQELKQDIGVQKANDVLAERFAQFGSESAILPTVVIPDDCTTLSFEKHLEFRTRFRGHFSTYSPTDFAAYVRHYSELYKSLESQTYIDPEDMSATAVLNLGDPLVAGHCDHTALIRCRKQGAFKALEKSVNTRLGQMELSDFIEDWKANVVVLGQSGDVMNHAIAVNAVRKVTIERARSVDVEVGNFENSASVSEREAAKNKEDLPAYLLFTCAPYDGFAEREIRVRIGINTGSDAPTFVMRIVAEEELREAVVDEFKYVLEAKLDELDSKVFIGEFSS